MRIASWLGALALVTSSWMGSAVAQDKPSNPNPVDSPSSSSSTGSSGTVNDKTSNTNTMNSQGSTSTSTSTSNTVGSSIVPPASPNASRNPSGSGTSTSGGVDYNGDNGADRTKR